MVKKYCVFPLKKKKIVIVKKKKNLCGIIGLKHFWTCFYQKIIPFCVVTVLYGLTLR